MQTTKTLIISALIGLAALLTHAEASAVHYGRCQVTCNGKTHNAYRCRVLGNTARIASADDGLTHLLIGNISVTADNSLPPCPY